MEEAIAKGLACEHLGKAFESGPPFGGRRGRRGSGHGHGYSVLPYAYAAPYPAYGYGYGYDPYSYDPYSYYAPTYNYGYGGGPISNLLYATGLSSAPNRGPDAFDANKGAETKPLTSAGQRDSSGTQAQGGGTKSAAYGDTYGDPNQARYVREDPRYGGERYGRGEDRYGRRDFRYGEERYGRRDPRYSSYGEGRYGDPRYGSDYGYGYGYGRRDPTSDFVYTLTRGLRSSVGSGEGPANPAEEEQAVEMYIDGEFARMFFVKTISIKDVKDAIFAMIQSKRPEVERITVSRSDQSPIQSFSESASSSFFALGGIKDPLVVKTVPPPSTMGKGGKP